MNSLYPSRKLGDLIKVHHGFAFKGEHFQEEASGLVVVTPGNFQIGGGFKSDKLKWYSPEGPIPEEFRLAPGTLLVTMTDLSKKADTLGFPAIVPDDDLLYLHNQRIGVVEVLRSDLVLQRYLYYAMRSSGYRNRVLATATGSTVHHTAPSRIGKAEIPLPEPEVQERIADILSSLDDKIKANRAMNRTLEAMAQALYRQWFVDFGPFKDGEFEDSELGEIPLGWKVGPIGKVVKAVGGSTPRTKNPEYWEGGSISWTTPKDLSSIESPVLLETNRQITEAGLATISSGLLPVGTVLMSSRAPVGYLAIAEIPVAVNQGYVAIPPSERMSNLYVLFWLQANMWRIKAHSGGTTFQEISKRNFRPLPMLVPPVDVLNHFDSEARPLYDMMVTNLRESRQLAETRDYLLPKLLSGEVEVGEGVEIAGAA